MVSRSDCDGSSWAAEVDVFRCFYCGEPATGEDHVVPRSMLEDLRILEDKAVTAVLVHPRRVLLVDCCNDCNARLSNSYTETLDQRRQLLKSKLYAKHKRLLETPDWSPEELAEIGPGLKPRFLARMAYKRLIKRRLAYQGAATYNGSRIVA